MSAAISFFRGFIREVLTIVGLAGATIAALIWGKIAGRVFAGFLEGFAEGPRKLIWGILPAELGGQIAGYLFTFLLVFAVLGVISHFIGKAVHDMGLNAIDRTMGFVFGVGRGFVLLGVVFIVVTWLDVKDRPDWINNAKMAPILIETAEWMKQIIPDDEITAKIKEKRKEKDAKDNKAESEETGTIQDLFKPQDDAQKDKEKGVGYKPEQRRALDQLLQQTED